MASGTLIAQETDITAGPLKVNDAYDLKLYKNSNVEYELIIFMKLQFFFEDNGVHKWTNAQRSAFMRDWETEIKKAWGNKTIKVLPSGAKFKLNFEFQSQEGGWMFDHWEITIKKIKPGDFSVSYVEPFMGNVTLDSEDLTAVTKKLGYKQRGAIHEFGHMLGLVDEYKSTSPHSADYDSVMNTAELIRPRHHLTYMKWLEEKIKELKIK